MVIVRLLFAFMVLAQLGLLYWSQLLLEEDLQGVKKIVISTQATMEELLQRMIKEKPATTIEGPREEKIPTELNGLNLLEEDPFEMKILPTLLGTHFDYQGERNMATIGRPENLHPFSNWSEVVEWVALCNVSLGKPHTGKFSPFAPDKAWRMEERIDGSGRKEYFFFLRKDHFWEPLEERFFSEKIVVAPIFQMRHPVTAHDFVFAFNAMMNPWVELQGAIASRSYFDDLEEIEAVDDYTLRVRWKVMEGKKNRSKFAAQELTISLQPLASFVYQRFLDGRKIIEEDGDPLIYRTSSLFGQNFNQHFAKNIIVSCGPWIFHGMDEKAISFRRNEAFYRPYGALSQRLTITFKESQEAIWEAFKMEEIDGCTLSPSQLPQLEEFLQEPKNSHDVKTLSFMENSYSYIGWNSRSPFFSNQRIRLAMTQLIDRERIIERILTGMGREITGPFSPFSKNYDQTILPWKYDPEEAIRTLDGLGIIDRDGDGIREIEGRPFRFAIVHYVKNLVVKSIVELIQTSLHKVGIGCDLHGVDMADLSSIFDDKKFDALYLGWSLGSPPEDPRQLWYSSLANVKGSSNAVGFRNAKADVIIDQLLYEDDLSTREKLYHDFHRIIHEEQPYTFLYAPSTLFVYRGRLKNVFVPTKRKDLIPDGEVHEPLSNLFYLEKS